MQVKNKWFILGMIAVLCAWNGWAQESGAEKIELTQADLLAIQENEAQLEQWFEELKTPGVRIEDNKMYFSEEAQQLIKDEAYRESVYKDEYTFFDVKNSLASYSFQKAFYQMLVMYPNHKEEVVAYIYAYDKVFPTDEVLISAFYTYGFFDPAITEITDGKPNIHRPDLFEEYLRRTREIIAYVHHFRKTEASQKS